MLLKCLEAASYEDLFHKLLASILLDESDVNLGTPHIFLAEKQLLNLASYCNCTDGIIYCVPLIVDVNDNLVLYLRLFYISFFIHIQTILC